jgi:autotransporter-associated beta strand protein
VILNRGVLRVTNNNTIFGTGDKTIIADSRNRGIELDGGVTLPSSISLTLSNDGDLTQAGATVPFAVHGMTGSNTINSPIALKIGGGNALLSVDAGGTLTVNGNMSIQPGQGGRSIQFGGAGNGFVNGVISDGSILDPMGFQIAGAGQPTWTINSANTCTANISLQSGTLILMNSQGLGFTSSGSFLNQAGTFCFIGNGGGAFAGVPAALNIGTDGLTVPNQLWTNRDGAGPLQAPNAESTERFITFSGASGTGTFSGTLLINGGVTFKSTPNGTLVMSGVLQNGTEAFATGGRNDVFIQSAGTVVFSGNNTYTGFTELDSGTLLLTNATAQSLIITGAGANGRPGGADIRGGRMVFDYGASGSGDPLPNIRPLLQTALAANFATGQFRVGNATPGIGIGYIDDTVGQKLQLLRTYLGDANIDGKVNALDFNALATNYGATGAAVWQQGDFNYDGSVDTLDFNQLAGNFNQSLPAPPAPGLGTLVPEPTSLLLVPVAGLLMRRKRRDKGV